MITTERTHNYLTWHEPYEFEYMIRGKERMNQGSGKDHSINKPDLSDPVNVFNEIHRRLERLELITVAQAVGKPEIAEKHIEAIKKEVAERLKPER